MRNPPVLIRFLTTDNENIYTHTDARHSRFGGLRTSGNTHGKPPSDPRRSEGLRRLPPRHGNHAQRRIAGAAPPTFSALSWNAFSDPAALPLLTPNPDALRIDTRLTSFGGMLDGVLNPNLASQVFPGTKGTRLDLRGVTYRLNNGLRISTYGEYDADGNRRYNPAALPWEKDDFNAALELKTDDGKFGLRIGVEKR